MGKSPGSEFGAGMVAIIIAALCVLAGWICAGFDTDDPVRPAPSVTTGR